MSRSPITKVYSNHYCLLSVTHIQSKLYQCLISNFSVLLAEPIVAVADKTDQVVSILSIDRLVLHFFPDHTVPSKS